jgi:shikimate kinase
LSCIILIGMPGAGKSTVGVLLAKALTKDFVDTDVLIQVRANQSLQSIVDNAGYLALRQLEEAVLLDLTLDNHVIATGGSAVYGKAAMEHLKTLGPVVYLNVSLAELTRRVKNLAERGIAARPGQGLEALYEERRPLYEQFADITVDCDGKTPEQVIAEIEQSSNNRTIQQ